MPTERDIRMGPDEREPSAEEIVHRGKDIADRARAVASDARVCSTSGEPPAKVRAEQTEPTGQHKSYLILCDAERAKGFVKPYRDSYKHSCGAVTTMGRTIAETYARDPYFYGSTFCVACNVHRPLCEFTWEPDGEPMDPSDPAWRAPDGTSHG